MLGVRSDAVNQMDMFSALRHLVVSRGHSTIQCDGRSLHTGCVQGSQALGGQGWRYMTVGMGSRSTARLRLRSSL